MDSEKIVQWVCRTQKNLDLKSQAVSSQLEKYNYNTTLHLCNCDICAKVLGNFVPGPLTPSCRGLESWSMAFTRGFVLDPTGGEPSDPMHPEPKIIVGAYGLLRNTVHC